MTQTNAQSRLNYMQQSPELVKKLVDFSMAIANSGHIEAGLSHLVDIRASQMNGCAFCLDMHVKEAKLHGERELRLYHVAIWRESPLFTPKERAALALTEALTQIAPTGISDELYAEVRSAEPYAGLARADFDAVLDFVATGGYALKAYERFAKIRQGKDGKWRVTHPRVAQRYRMNIGTIVEADMLKVRLMDIGYRHYMSKEERREPLEKVRARFDAQEPGAQR